VSAGNNNPICRATIRITLGISTAFVATANVSGGKEYCPNGGTESPAHDANETMWAVTFRPKVSSANG